MEQREPIRGTKPQIFFGLYFRFFWKCSGFARLFFNNKIKSWNNMSQSENVAKLARERERNNFWLYILNTAEVHILQPNALGFSTLWYHSTSIIITVNLCHGFRQDAIILYHTWYIKTVIFLRDRRVIDMIRYYITRKNWLYFSAGMSICDAAFFTESLCKTANFQNVELKPTKSRVSSPIRRKAHTGNRIAQNRKEVLESRRKTGTKSVLSPACYGGVW